MKLLYSLIEIYNQLSTYAPIIQIAVATTVISFILSLFLFTYLLYNKLKNKKNKNTIKTEIKNLFQKILFGDIIYSEDTILSKFTKIAGSLNSQNIILAIDILLEIKFSSSIKSRRYQLIVDALKFEKLLDKKLNYTKGSLKNTTLQKLEKLNSKNNSITTTLNFNNINPYSFFSEFKEDLTYWDEINLLKFLRIENDKDQLINLANWINYSKNISLTIFLIKAAGIFEVKNTEKIIYEKTKSKNVTLRTEAYRSLGKLKAIEFESRLIRKFFLENEKCKLEIIKSLGLMDTGDCLSFFKNAYQEASSIALKKEIALASFSYKSYYKLFVELKDSENGFDKTIFNYIETRLGNQF